MSAQWSAFDDVNNVRLRPFKPAEIERLVAACRAATRRVGHARADHWWTAVVLTGLDCPVPITELLDVQPSDYDDDHGLLAAGPVVYGLRDETRAAIRVLADELPKDRERLFPWHLDPDPSKPRQSLYLHFKRLLIHAGIPAKRGDSLQRLVATAAIHAEVDRLPIDWRRVEDLAEHLRRQPRPFLYRRGVQAGSVKKARGRNLKHGRPIGDAEWAARQAEGIREKSSGLRPLVIVGSDSPRRITAFFESTFRPRRLVDSTDKHVRDCRLVMRKLNEFTGHEVVVDQLSDDLLERFAASCLRTRSKRTVNRYLTILVAIWHYAYRRKLLNERPGVELYRVPKRKPESWGVGELERIVAEAARPGRKEIAGIRAELFLPALILFVYDTGFRLGAATAVETSQLDLETGWVRVPAEEQKHYADEVKRLHPQTVAAILAMKPEGRVLLFPLTVRRPRPDGRDGKPTSSRGLRQLYNLYRDVLKAAGLPYGSKHLFHKLRRTSGTFVAAADGDQAASRHLGHADVNTTRASYIDPSKLKSPTAIDVLPRPGFAPSESAERSIRIAEVNRQLRQAEQLVEELERKLAAIDRG